VKRVAETVGAAAAVAAVVAAVVAVAAAVVVAAVVVAAAAARVLFPSSHVTAAFGSCSCSWRAVSAVGQKNAEIDHGPDGEQVMQMLQTDGLGKLHSFDGCPAADRVGLEFYRGRAAV
jgi:hypothetical protein